jgi:glycerol uptake facilitator-like aquaporin
MKARALVAEFIGTFALLFVVFLTVNNFMGNPQLQLLAIALGVGFTILALGTAFGAISGGHFNPCVTFAMMIAKKISLADGLAYWVVQILGGIAAVFTAAFLLGANGEAARAAISVGRGAGIEILPAIIAEAIAAFLFVTVIFMTAVDRRAPANGALYLGLTLTIGILAIGPISGGAINPAVGVALSVGSGKWDNALSWSIGPLFGAGLAALLYTGMWSKEDGPA